MILLRLNAESPQLLMISQCWYGCPTSFWIIDALHAEKETSGYKPVDVNLNVTKLGEILVGLWNSKHPSNFTPPSGCTPAPAPVPQPRPPPPRPPPPPPAPVFAVPNVNFKAAAPLHIQDNDIQDCTNTSVAIHVSRSLLWVSAWGKKSKIHDISPRSRLKKLTAQVE